LIDLIVELIVMNNSSYWIYRTGNEHSCKLAPPIKQEITQDFMLVYIMFTVLGNSPTGNHLVVIIGTKLRAIA